jgi:hypothetical protein
MYQQFEGTFYLHLQDILNMKVKARSETSGSPYGITWFHILGDCNLQH